MGNACEVVVGAALKNRNQAGGFDTRLGRARGETWENESRDGDQENEKMGELKNQRAHKD